MIIWKGNRKGIHCEKNYQIVRHLEKGQFSDEKANQQLLKFLFIPIPLYVNLWEQRM